MDINRLCEIEFGVKNKEEARINCLQIISDIKAVIDIKGLNYIETYLRLLGKEDK